MTQDHHHHRPSDQHAPDDHEHAAFFDALLHEQPLNLAALVRACADGELTRAQCDRLAACFAQHPQARSQVEFERSLRDCCRRVLGAPLCPQRLRDQIASLAATGGAQEPLPAQPDPAPETPAAQDRRLWGMSPVLAIAAMLMLTFAGVLIWQSIAFSGNVPVAPGLSIGQSAYYERVSDFVVREHNRCCADEAAREKLIRHDINQAVEYFSAEFGRPVALPDLTLARGEVEFYGGGDCRVPSTARSGHLRFDALDRQGRPVAMSLFIAPDPGLLPLKEGTTYLISAKACSDSGAHLFAWVSDGIQYLLVSEATDDMCASMRRLMKAPPTLSSI